MTSRLAALATVSVLALGLASCAQENPPAAPAPAPSPITQTSPTQTTESAPTAAPTTTSQQSAPATDTQERNAAALRAVGTAAAAAGGTAYELDDEDDYRRWEVDVMVGDRSVEVTVSGDGTTVISQDDDDDDDEDDRARLGRATVSMTEAIEIALAEVPGLLDDVELDDEDGQDVWEVGIDTGSDDVEVSVSTTDGTVVKVDR